MWYLLFDSGDGVTGWREFIGVSLDRGVTWTVQIAPPGLDTVTTGTWLAVATGWLEKRGSTYYRHRVTTNTLFGPPDTGLPEAPYGWDTWSASSILGTWTGIANVATAGFASAYIQPGCVVLSGGTYYGFCTGQTRRDLVDHRALHRDRSRWHLYRGHRDRGCHDTGTGLEVSRKPQGFFTTRRWGVWCCLSNMITSGGFTDSNAIGYSSSVSDWSEATWDISQVIGALDGFNTIGVAAHITGPDGALIVSSDGYVPFVLRCRRRRVTRRGGMRDGKFVRRSASPRPTS